MRVPFADAMLVKLPPGLDPVAAAALGDNAVDGFRAVYGGLARAVGARVLVAGGGVPSVAMYAVSAARALGAKEVVYVDTAPDSRPDRRGARRDRGAQTARSAAPARPVSDRGQRHYQRGRPAVLRREHRARRNVHKRRDLLDRRRATAARDVHARHHVITGRVHARGQLPAALALAASGAFALAPIATKHVTWDRAPEAWPEPATKLVITREVA